MNVKNNQQYKESGTSSTTDAVINELLAKYDLNKVADSVGRRNLPLNNNTSENENEHRKEVPKDQSQAAKMYKTPNLDDTLKSYSKNHESHEDRRNVQYCNNVNDYLGLMNSQNKNFFHDNPFASGSENTRNMDANLAFLKSKLTIPRINNEHYGNTIQNREFIRKAHSEKTTYCRPVCNIYNEEFIMKTLERNAKLQTLLQKLILTRRREKEREEWNNYVNELKNKHNFNYNFSHTDPRHVPQERCFIEPNDIYEINRSETRKNLIDDFGYATPHEYNYYPQIRRTADEGFCSGYVSENENEIHYCYPMASHGRTKMVERDRNRVVSGYHNPPPRREVYVPRVIYHDMAIGGNARHVSISDDVSDPETEKGIEASETDAKPHVTEPQITKSQTTKIQTTLENNRYEEPPPSHKTFYVPMIIRIEKEKKTKKRSVSISAEEITHNKSVEGRTCSTQYQGLQDNGVQASFENKTIKEKYDEVTKNVERLKAQIDSNDQTNQEQGYMSIIERKLDMVTKCLTELITTMKNKGSSTNSSVKDSKVKKQDDKDSSVRNENLTVGYVETNTSTSAFQTFPCRLRRFEPATMIDDIICEELDKSNRLRRELGELLHTQTQQSHSVQIILDIPTKERATEVTDSLPRTEISEKGVDEMSMSLSVEESQITIAVNTDPLGLLTLLTMSTDVVRQLMSYVPAVDYSWCLSRLPLPRLSLNNVEEFVCNICGASFARPSQLSDHMQNHDFGDTKDCCVCRHVLDLKRRPTGLFPCRYCGQRFTRAYCCELHQQSCARARGLRHDVEPALTLLQ